MDVSVRKYVETVKINQSEGCICKKHNTYDLYHQISIDRKKPLPGNGASTWPKMMMIDKQA